MIKKWGLLPIGFKGAPISFALLIFMAAIEIVLSLSDWIAPSMQWRLWANANFALYDGQALYAYVTYALLHGFLFHMVMNMLVFGQTGPICERRMGTVRFILFTLLAAILSGYGGVNIAEMWRGQQVLLVGFSGVVFAYIGVVLRHNIDGAQNKLAAIVDLAKRNVLLILFIVAPFVLPSLNISGEAHLIGFIFGYLAAPFFLK